MCGCAAHKTAQLSGFIVEADADRCHEASAFSQTQRLHLGVGQFHHQLVQRLHQRWQSEVLVGLASVT